MFWGDIMMDQKTRLISVQQTLTSCRYVDLVLVRLSRGAKLFLETEYITVLKRSVCLPELNPIQKLWDMLKRIIGASRDNLQNTEQLVQAKLDTI